MLTDQPKVDYHSEQSEVLLGKLLKAYREFLNSQRKDNSSEIDSSLPDFKQKI